ncbi:MAG: hypothetical protein AAF600_10490 [Bacteroidota bacterium]
MNIGGEFKTIFIIDASGTLVSSLLLALIVSENETFSRMPLSVCCVLVIAIGSFMEYSTLLICWQKTNEEAV